MDEIEGYIRKPILNYHGEFIKLWPAVFIW